MPKIQILEEIKINVKSHVGGHYREVHLKCYGSVFNMLLQHSLVMWLCHEGIVSSHHLEDVRTVQEFLRCAVRMS